MHIPSTLPRSFSKSMESFLFVSHSALCLSILAWHSALLTQERKNKSLSLHREEHTYIATNKTAAILAQ